LIVVDAGKLQQRCRHGAFLIFERSNGGAGLMRSTGIPRTSFLPHHAMIAAKKALPRRHQTVIRWARLSAGYCHPRHHHVATLWNVARASSGGRRQHAGLATRRSCCRGLSAVASHKPDDNYTKNTTSAVTTTDESSNLPSLPIDFDIAAKIEGQESHIATIELLPGETLRAESGAMLYMTDGVESMFTHSVR
jgi:hypothetical protein